MWYARLADLVVALHVVYVSYVVFGQLAIFLGVLLRWQWIRNPWFRWTQFVMILIVAFEAVMDITCPLTTWEYNLRHLAGQQAAEGSFMGRLLHDLMFFTAPQWVFTTGYITFATLVLGTLLLAPPRRFRKHAAPVRPGHWFTFARRRPTTPVEQVEESRLPVGGHGT